MNGSNKNECREKAIELLEKVKLSGYENRYTDELSGGQIQRIALARAIAAEPSVLLLDEPFSSLDLNLRKDMRQLVLDLHKDYNMTTILVTHDHEEALTMSDRIAFMHNGKIEQYDTPENIFKNPISLEVADYFSEGVYIDGEVIDKEFISELFTIDVNKSNGKYKCLTRPLSIKTSKSDCASFKVVDKIYKGDTNLLKIKHTDHDFVLESIAPHPTDIVEGDMVNIELDKEKLIFIANR